jgi:hypothetical protein
MVCEIVSLCFGLADLLPVVLLSGGDLGCHLFHEALLHRGLARRFATGKGTSLLSSYPEAIQWVFPEFLFHAK